MFENDTSHKHTAELTQTLREAAEFLEEVAGRPLEDVLPGQTDESDTTISTPAEEFQQRSVILLSQLERLTFDCFRQQVEQLLASKKSVRDALDAPRTNPPVSVGCRVLAPRPENREGPLFPATVTAHNSKTVSLQYDSSPEAAARGWADAWSKCSRRWLHAIDPDARDDVEVIVEHLHAARQDLRRMREMKPWAEIRKQRLETQAAIGPLLEKTGQLSPEETNLLLRPVGL